MSFDKDYSFTEDFCDLLQSFGKLMVHVDRRDISSARVRVLTGPFASFSDAFFKSSRISSSFIGAISSNCWGLCRRLLVNLASIPHNNRFPVQYCLDLLGYMLDCIINRTIQSTQFVFILPDVP